MRAVVTRCSSARVTLAGHTVGTLPAPGLLILVGVTHSDSHETAQKLVHKIAHLRILDGEHSVLEVGAPILLVSQFTLYGSVRKGRRPSWSDAAGRAEAELLVEQVAQLFQDQGIHVESGAFGEMMQVESVNDGPFTICIDTADLP